MGRIGSLRVRCRSVWLLHFAAVLRPFGPGNLTTEQCVQQRHASAEACRGSPCAGQLVLVLGVHARARQVGLATSR